MHSLTERSRALLDYVEDRLDENSQKSIAKQRSHLHQLITDRFDQVAAALALKRQTLLDQLDELCERRQSSFCAAKDALSGASPDVSADQSLLRSPSASSFSTRCDVEHDFCFFNDQILVALLAAMDDVKLLTYDDVVPEAFSLGADVAGQGVAPKQQVCFRLTSSRLVEHRFLPFEIEMTEAGKGSLGEGLWRVRKTSLRAFEFGVTFNRSGVFSVSVRLFGRHVSGSPLTLGCREPEPQRVPFWCGGAASPAGRRRRYSSGGELPHSARRRQHRSVATLPDDVRGGVFAPDERPDFLYSFGNFGTRDGQFTNAQDILFYRDSAPDAAARLCVSDIGNGSIQIFSAADADSGRFLRRVGERGRNLWQVVRPSGLCVEAGTRTLFVADSELGCVKTYCVDDGRFLTRLGFGKLQRPKALAVNSAGLLYVADQRLRCIHCFDRQARYLTKLTDTGPEFGQPSGPCFLAVTPLDELVVSDFQSHCVRVFDASGRFRFQIGRRLAAASPTTPNRFPELTAPTGVTSDCMGNILVASAADAKVHIVDPRGCYVGSVKTGNLLHGPQAIAALPNKTMAVVDSGNHCVKVFKYLT